MHSLKASIHKFNISSSDYIQAQDRSKAGNHLCGGAIISEFFGISTAHCMFKTSRDIIYESRAGEHDRRQIDGHEQL